MATRIFLRYFPLILILWIVLVLYPNPANIVISIHRILNFDADPSAVEYMLDDLPSEPAEIERAILARVPYHRDWELYGMPWYCPTVKQVVQRGGGDCKGRALVLASVLEAKNISYQIRSSPMHIWVYYESKEETPVENAEVVFFRFDPETGAREFQIPDVSRSELMSGLQEQFWTPMPDDRRILLLSGSLGLVVVRVILGRKKSGHQSM